MLGNVTIVFSHILHGYTTGEALFAIIHIDKRCLFLFTSFSPSQMITLLGCVTLPTPFMAAKATFPCPPMDQRSMLAQA